ncbi:hypothetical protein BS50DRAFT_142936 [Corynespora cassiicola Philippines]|uniref:Uncharacterized protein n=1 Tax=Corynespora cassiicola Philippines TaxID=1448308 RepID=A0A2T2MZD9_CORCC|nr:hypothetical protein BS50DRAFT_142936 [Corynespora cassiicola Philippines]
MELVSQYIDLQALESGQIQERDHGLSRGEQPSDHDPRKRRKGNRHPNSSARISAAVGPLHMDHAMNHNIPNAGSTVASSSVTREGSIDQLPSSRPQDNTLDEFRYAHSRQDGDIHPHLNAVDLAQGNGNARLNQLNGITCNNTEELFSMASAIPNASAGCVGAIQPVRVNVVDEMPQISSSWSRLGDEFQHSELSRDYSFEEYLLIFAYRYRPSIRSQPTTTCLLGDGHDKACTEFGRSWSQFVF